jgi:hypothetical protein
MIHTDFFRFFRKIRENLFNPWLFKIKLILNLFQKTLDISFEGIVPLRGL